MTLPETIELTIKFRVKDLVEMIESADLKIKDQAGFEKLIKSKKFAEDFGLDLYQAWSDSNEFAEYEGQLTDIVEGLFDELVEPIESLDIDE